MKSFLLYASMFLIFASCGRKDTRAGSDVNADSLMDSTELKQHAETTEKKITHIGDSIEQMQRQAEAEAAN